MGAAMVNLSFPISELEYFLLIFTRITCFIHIAPFYSTNNTPRRVKIGLGFFVSVLVYYLISPHPAVEYSTVWQFGAIVLKEAVTGILVGFGAYICSMIVTFAGSMVDMEIGLSMMSEFDPATRQNMTITGVYYQYLIMLILIVSGMYQYVLRALIDTFTLIPVNAAVIHAQRLLDVMLRFMQNYFLIGFRICLPVFIVMMIVNTVLGVLAKVAPQLNMFAVGIQIKIMVGLSVMFLTVDLLPNVAGFIYTEMKRMIVAFVEAMM